MIVSERPPIVLHTNAPDVVFDIVSAAHPDLPISICRSYAGLADAIARADAEIIYSVRFDGTPHFPREALVDSTTVKWVSVGGSGVDHIFPWDPLRLTVTNAAGAAANMMAEYVIGMILAFSLGLRGLLRNQEACRWSSAWVEPLEGKTLLIVGIGKTGQAIARLTKALGMNTIGIRANPQPEPYVDEMFDAMSVAEACRRADFIACCVPLLPSTRGLLGREAFAAMKPSAVLVDVSRGGIVDEKELLKALESGRLKGAALDVFASEPLPPEHPLWRCENAIITPHCSSNFKDWEARSARMFSDNVGRYRRGEKLENIVRPERGY
jgi:phosphoglycerate dehydrogenase-like enzyme